MIEVKPNSYLARPLIYALFYLILGFMSGYWLFSLLCWSGFSALNVWNVRRYRHAMCQFKLALRSKLDAPMPGE